MKTIKVRLGDDTYQAIKLAANGNKCHISNFIEFATMQYLTSEQYVDGEKMVEILRDKELVANLKKGLKDIKDGDYSIV